jgi:hypothetical protein
LVKRDILYSSGAFLYFTFAARNASSWLSPKKDLNIERIKDGTEGH